MSKLNRAVLAVIACVAVGCGGQGDVLADLTGEAPTGTARQGVYDYHNSYTDADPATPNTNSCFTTQGVAVGTTYVYFVKTNAPNDTKQTIYATNQSTHV